MESINEMKKKARKQHNQSQKEFESKLIPIAKEIYKNNKDTFIKEIEADIFKHMKKGYNRVFFQMYGEVSKLCVPYGITEHIEVCYIEDYIEEKLILFLKKKGYLYTYVYNSGDMFHTSYFLVWNKLEYILCKVRNILRIDS